MQTLRNTKIPNCRLWEAFFVNVQTLRNEASYWQLKNWMFFSIFLVGSYLFIKINSFYQFHIYKLLQILWISHLRADFEKLFYDFIIKKYVVLLTSADFEKQMCRLWEAKAQTLRNINFCNTMILKVIKSEKNALTNNLFLTIQPRNIYCICNHQNAHKFKHPLGYADY